MTSQFRNEIDSNFDDFSAQWILDLENAKNSLNSEKERFSDNYFRITSIQAWRSVIADKFSEQSEAFFFEAQNDLLISHCLSRCGSFRSALKALRAAIENVCFFIYYKDHPIELEKWREGRHKLGFSELMSYLESHPKMVGKVYGISCLGVLRDEYATLSKAVHGSAVEFRMTSNISEIQLWKADVVSVGKWASREKKVIFSLNIILIYIFREYLMGAQALGLREILGLLVPRAKHAVVRQEVGVALIKR